MTSDPQRDDAGRGVRRPPFQCGNATLVHDSHGPGHRCCGVAVLPRNMTAREHWNMGPTLRDADATITHHDQDSVLTLWR